MANEYELATLYRSFSWGDPFLFLDTTHTVAAASSPINIHCPPDGLAYKVAACLLWHDSGGNEDVTVYIGKATPSKDLFDPTWVGTDIIALSAITAAQTVGNAAYTPMTIGDVLREFVFTRDTMFLPYCTALSIGGKKFRTQTWLKRAPYPVAMKPPKIKGYEDL